MKYSRTALGLLNAQYRSVLRKCFLINMGLFALGAVAATPANAVNITADTNLNEQFPDGTLHEIINSISGYTGTLTTDNISIDPTSGSRGVQVWYDNSKVVLGADNTESVKVNSANNIAVIAGSKSSAEINGNTVELTGKTSALFASGNSNITVNAKDEMIATSDGNAISAWATGSYDENSGGKINISTGDLTVTSGGIGVGANYAKSQINIDATGDVNITATERAIHAGNSTTEENITKEDTSYVSIKAENITLTSDDMGVSAMSNGIVELDGNTKIVAKDAILARGLAKVEINKSGENTVQMDGNINFNYDKATSGSKVDAIVDVTLSGEDSYWKGNTTASYGSGEPPSGDYLNVSSSTLTLKDGATWTATKITDNTGDTEGQKYAALNNLTVDHANVVVKDETRGITVDNLVAKEATISEGVLNVAKTVDTIDDVIDDYTGKVNLQNGVTIKGDINFMAGTSDTYSADSGSTVTYSIANLIGTTGQGTKNIQVVSDGATVNVSAGIFDSSTGLTAVSSGSADGQIKVTGLTGGIENAADASGTVASITYDMTTDESIDTAKEIKDTFVLNGDGTTSGDAGLTLNADLGVAGNADMTMNDLKLSGAGSLNNAGRLHINDSDVAVAVNNYGTLFSDPTTYSGTVTNAAGAYASFEGDTFTGTATLSNSGTATFKDMTFEKGSKIDGNGATTGVLNFNGGDYTLLVEDNNINLENGAKIALAEGSDIDGQNLTNDANNGTIDLRNKRIDTLGSTSLGSDLNVLMDLDLNLNADKSDTLGTITNNGYGLNLNALELLALGGDEEHVQIATAGTDVALSSDVTNTLKTYYKNVEYTSADGKLNLTDKQQYASADLVGSWGSGNYIKAYNSADAAGTSVGANLTILDEQVKTNEDAISAAETAIGNINDDITVATAGNYIAAGTEVANNLTALDTQVKSNADNIAKRTVTVDSTTGIASITDGTNTANVYTKAAAEAIFTEKQKWVDNTLGIFSADADAVKEQYASTNYLKNATTLTGADKALDSTIKTVDNKFTDGSVDAKFKSVTTTGDATIGGDLNVAGTSNLKNTNVNGKLAVSGDTDISGVLAVHGMTYLTNAVVGKDFAVTGTSNLHNTNVDGALNVTGESWLKNTHVGGALAVAGQSYLHDASIDGDMAVSGTTKTTALTFNGESYVAAMDQGDAAITNGTVDDQAKRTMATTATVAKTIGKLANLENTHGVTSVADVASAINSLATNVETATGGTFTNAVWTGKVTVGTTTDYTYGGDTGYKNVMAAVSNIASNIGAETAAAKGNIAKNKTVNANLDQLDEAIGDRRNLGSANEAINQGTKTSVAAGMRAVGDAIGDMNFAGSHYVAGNNDLSGAVRSLDSNLYRVESDLRDLRRDFRRGMASMSAMSALVPNPRAHGNTSLAIGTGAYDGHTAAAIGGFHYLTDNIMLNAGVAWGNSSDAAYRMGVTFSW